MLDLQDLCERGQEQLVAMKYAAAEATFEQAGKHAFDTQDYDTLGRLYMPLQEARRQRRQRCGEGTVRLNLLATGPDDPSVDPLALIELYPQGQLLIAGWGSIAPALRFRELARERGSYVETYLAAVYATGAGPRAVVIVPLDNVRLPEPKPMQIDTLMRSLPAHSIVLSENELPPAIEHGTAQSYAGTMALWERLHSPFLAAADMQADALRKIESYRTAIRVDYACELAHQKLSDTARNYARSLGR